MYPHNNMKLFAFISLAKYIELIKKNTPVRYVYKYSLRQGIVRAFIDDP
jgi:hypothetical protein